MYPAPFEKNLYMIKSYCLDGSSILKDTIEILNPEKAGVFQPIPAKKVSKYSPQYVDDNFDFLGSFEDADKVDEDIQVDEDDDGFEEADDAEADEI